MSARITKLVPRREPFCRHDLPGGFMRWVNNIGKGSIAVCSRCNAGFILAHPCWDWEGNHLVWKEL